MNVKNVKKILAVFFLLCGSQFVHADWDNEGFAFFPLSSDAYCSQDFFDSVQSYKQEAKGNMVSLIVTWFQENRFSSTHRRGYNTPSDAALACGLQYLSDNDMQVTMLVQVENSSAEPQATHWRAYMDPANRNAWFRSMGGILRKYARDFAQPYNVKYFSVGTEMHHLISTDWNADNASNRGEYRWCEMIQQEVRPNYFGKVTYSAQHSGDKSALLEGLNGNGLKASIFSCVDVIGLSPYFPINASNLSGVISEWGRIERDHLLPAYRLHGKRLAFTEGGYRSVPFALQRPYDSWSSGSYDGQTQALAYEGMFTFFQGKSYFDGFLALWAYEVDPDRCGVGNTQYTPCGKPAMNVIARYFGGGNAIVAQNSSSQSSASSTVSACIDPDGDGWGWDGRASCRVGATPVSSSNSLECIDPDGDGWGWDGRASCRVGATPVTTSQNTSNTQVSSSQLRTCSSASADPDGDGWGWENNQTCLVTFTPVTVVQPSNGLPRCNVGTLPDHDGDGRCWNWEQRDCDCS